MKRLSLVITVFFLVIIFVSPTSASAATNLGITPSSFFYFFDTAFERVSLFFTFNHEKKARKALEYADERLAEAEDVAKEKNTNAVKTAVAGYESSIVLAAEESKKIKDKGMEEGLLISIADNTSKHQEVLSAILIKVPDEAKEAITQAIEASKKGQEEATKQIVELKNEIEKLKNEVAELKKESNNPQANELEKLKKEIDVLKENQRASQPATKQPTPAVQQLQEQRKLEPSTISNESQKLAEEQKRQDELKKQQELERTRLEESRRQQEIVRQEELRKQTELEKEKQLYQQKQQDLDNLINEVNRINQQKLSTEQEYRVQENEFIVTYCKKKEDEVNSNYASRGLYFSGVRQATINDLKITCPIEARNLFNASLNSATYPFVVQLQNMQKQFREYNQGLYSKCSQVSYNCSIYFDAAFPVNF